MDEAVLRIVAVDGGTQSAGGGSAPAGLSGGGSRSQSFDAEAEARKQREREERRQQVEEAYEKLFPTPAQVFDAEAEARKLHDAQDRRKQIEEAYLQLFPTPQQVFDAEAEARKVLDARNRRKQIDEALERISPTPVEVFDPIAEARRRRASEERSQQIREAYASLYGGQSRFAGVGQAALGTLSGAGSGIFGTLGGAASAAASALGPLGIAAIATAGGMYLLNRQLSSLTDRYADYNGQIAASQAIAEVRSIAGDIRRANQVGPHLSRFINAQSNFEQRWEDVKAEASGVLAQFGEKNAQLGTILLDLLTLKGWKRFPDDVLRYLNIISDNTEQPEPGARVDPREIFTPEL